MPDVPRLAGPAGCLTCAFGTGPGIVVFLTLLVRRRVVVAGEIVHQAHCHETLQCAVDLWKRRLASFFAVTSAVVACHVVVARAARCCRCGLTSRFLGFMRAAGPKRLTMCWLEV